jgi:hypothetical protein
MKRRHLLIGMAAFAGGLVFGLLLIREPMAPLTAENLAAARERWHAAGITSYSIRYKLNADLYEVVVEDRIVTSARVNGQPPISPDWRSFTVEGLFRVLEMELENMTDPGGAMASQKDAILARVRFHHELGYVQRYLRGSAGMGRPASIRVLEFAETE